jgi:predicted metalloendopeptidase
MSIEIPIPKLEGYVICDVDEQTFSSGGCLPAFTKRPKFYKKIGHVKNHLNLHSYKRFSHYNEPTKTVTLIVSDDYKNRNCVVYDIRDNSVVLNVTEYFKEQLNKMKNEYITRYNYNPENVIIDYEKI